jgi:FkbM family methyltransferase
LWAYGQIVVLMLSLLTDYRQFRHPVLVGAAKLSLIPARYCSCDVRAHGQTYAVLARPQAGDPSVIREVLMRETYRAVLPLLPKRPLRVVDVGAHIGMFTLWLSRQVQLESVVCFEPDPESSKLCRFNLAHLAVASILQVAVGSHASRATIHIDPHGSSRSTLVENLPGRSANTASAEVPVIALPEWCEQHGPIDLLKMDCEGGEWDLVRHCPRVFTRATTIIAELHDDPVERRTHEDFRQAVRDLGFRVIQHPHLFLATTA